MFAIVDIAGKQFKVEKDMKVFVNRLKAEEGSDVEFDKVMLIDNDGKVKVGKPIIKNAKVTAKVLAHLKGDKVKIFKKKRRKGYQIENGFRHSYTQIQINDIVE
jgi:large subunit ribosomal protein L21